MSDPSLLATTPPSININLLISVLLVFVGLTNYINHRYLKLPNAIGIMGLSAVISLFVKWLYSYDFIHFDTLNFVKNIDFKSILLEGVLGYLLFASAIHVNVSALKRWWKQISLLATVGVFISAFFIGAITYYSFGWLGFNIPFIYCLLFGALISPTDPIAALAVLNSTNAPEDIKIKLTGESLFNDGSGIVMFIAVLGLTVGIEQSALDFTKNFIVEVSGAVTIGLITGYISSALIKRSTDFGVISILSLSAASISYLLANHFHFSAPISTVIAGLFIGINGDKIFTKDNKDEFNNLWEMIDNLLNSMLFALIGLEVVLIEFSPQLIILGIISFVAVIIGRYLSVLASLCWFFNKTNQGTIPLLTWGGIRGGISLALALSIPANGEFYHLILGITVITVLMSGIVQGLTLKHVINYYSVEQPNNGILSKLLQSVDLLMIFKKRKVLAAKLEEAKLRAVNEKHLNAMTQKITKEVNEMCAQDIEENSDIVSAQAILNKDKDEHKDVKKMTSAEKQELNNTIDKVQEDKF